MKHSSDRKRVIKMFLDNLSTSVLRLCDARKLSYEAASERCNLSSRYFADIARGRAVPTILTLEKLCVGFKLTPNDLLIPADVWRDIAFREPMPVTQVRCFRYHHGLTGFPVCPRCGATMERDYQIYCDRCGQRLDWNNFSKAAILLPQE
ncbi:helix-turn-helix domain-containing protein [Agathobaculum desmolans]|jgi:transcriptional regulator with XRE-family HTH domain|uniref:helix-turn-helix domain-containing protein n=2 Tax=Agathobaculum desmolans TaxID=39484 RepID=UPI0038B393A7